MAPHRTTICPLQIAEYKWDKTTLRKYGLIMQATCMFCGTFMVAIMRLWLCAGQLPPSVQAVRAIVGEGGNRAHAALGSTAIDVRCQQ